MENTDGPSASGYGKMKRDPEKVKQRKLKRGKRREERRKYGYNKKRRAEYKADAQTKAKALAQAAIVGGDHQAGGDSGSQESQIVGGQFEFGGSMRNKEQRQEKRAARKEKRALLRDNPVVDKSVASAAGEGGAPMSGYQDKEASMDDYSHEKKLGADGRYELEHGKKAAAENDFDHAHALKKDAHHDAEQRKHAHPILKHMKRF